VYTFESTLLLAVSQMALARYKTTMADRTKRHISTDLSTDWLDLIKKAIPVVGSVKGKGAGGGGGVGGKQQKQVALGVTKTEPTAGLLLVVRSFIESRLKGN
jgi:hypothetical protein